MKKVNYKLAYNRVRKQLTKANKKIKVLRELTPIVEDEPMPAGKKQKKKLDLAWMYVPFRNNY